MANFQKIWPFGAPFKGVFKSTEADTWDGYFPKIPNWKEGSDHTLDAGSQVTLGGDNTTSIRFDLAVGITYTLSLAPDAGLYFLGTSGHPSAAIWQNYAQAQWESGSTAAFQSGASATWESGSAAVWESGSTQEVQAGADAINESALGVQFTGTQPAATADPGADNLAIATNQTKAWGQLSMGNNAVTLHDGMNIASVAIDMSNDFVQVTFARPMANANYAVVFGVNYTTGTPVPVNFPIASNRTINGFELWNFEGCGANASGGAAVHYSMASGNVGHFSFDVKARQ